MRTGRLCLGMLLVGWMWLGQARGADIVQETVAAGKWQPLWDGKTLNGWHAIGTGKWTIENGQIVGTHAAKDKQFGGHLVTNASYRDFVARVKFKLVKGESGLYFRISELRDGDIAGLKAVIDARGNAGGLYERNGRTPEWVAKPIPEDVKKWFKPNDWNEMVVAALGRTLVVYVNGMKSAEVRNDPGRLPEGKLALQLAAGEDCQIYLKDLQIMPFESLTAKDLAAFAKPTGEWKLAGNVVVDTADGKTFLADEGGGAIYNGGNGRTNNLFTAAQYGDVAAHIEFMIPRKSNSGVYFQGRYEIQIYDSFGVERDEYPGIECGGIYPRWINETNKDGHSPRVNASLPPGQWQSFDVIFQAPKFGAGARSAYGRFVKVVHNGQVIHENVPVSGPTRAAAFNDEKPLGPLMFQGDHGPVAYRNVCVYRLGK